MKRNAWGKVFRLLLVVLSLGLVILSPGSMPAQNGASQTPGKIVKFADDLSPVDSVISEANGNIGIGTMNPSSPGGRDRVLDFTATNAPGFVLRSNNPSYINPAWELLLQIQSPTQTQFAINDGTTNRFAIDPNGNVGIGTTNPQSKLEVIGGDERTTIQAQNTSSHIGRAGNFLITNPNNISPAIFAAHSGSGGGVLGVSNGGTAVFGTSSNNGTGVAGYSESGYAGFFTGRGRFTGFLEKAGGGFKIDHPLDPENKYLNHFFVESPDMKNLYDGMVVLNVEGEAWVELPDYFETLNRDFHYQLTCIGSFAPVYIAEEISGNRFKIAGGHPGGKVSWQVTGIRQDAWAKANRIPVEEEKSAAEKGYYQNPDVYGQPKTKSIQWGKNPEMMKQLQEELERVKLK